MADNITSLVEHPKYKGVKHAGPPAVQSRFSETDDLPPEIIQAIEVRIEGHLGKKLHQGDRRALAENLGALLKDAKEERGLLTKLFLQAGIASNKEESTKRLPRLSVVRYFETDGRLT